MVFILYINSIYFGGHVLIAKDDRRIFQRMAIEADVVITKGATTLKGVCKDLSSTGMSIQLNGGVLSPGDKVEILLDTHNDSFPPLNAEADILRIQEQDEKQIIAVEFTSVK